MDLQSKTSPSDIGHDHYRSDDVGGGDLFLEELVTHGKEGDGQTRAKEDDEVEGQLVPGSKYVCFKHA